MEDSKDKIVYDPNDCTTRDNCPGAGHQKHIRHTLDETPLLKLIGGILQHCGENVSTVMSCMCASYAREIGRRGTPIGEFAHRKAVEQKQAYLVKKYSSLKGERNG